MQRTFKVDVCVTGIGSLGSYVLRKTDPYIYLGAENRKDAEARAIEIALDRLRPEIYTHVTETTP